MGGVRAVRLELLGDGHGIINKGDGRRGGEQQSKGSAAAASSASSSFPLPHLHLITKPTWVVKAESNVLKEMRRKKPHPPCVLCKGTGKVDCYHCSGKGRTNFVDLPMLPKGEWPKWCRRCGGSGLSCCFRCLGSGEHRHPMGFHFTGRYQDQDHQLKVKSPDPLFNGDLFDSV